MKKNHIIVIAVLGVGVYLAFFTGQNLTLSSTTEILSNNIKGTYIRVSGVSISAQTIEFTDNFCNLKFPGVAINGKYTEEAGKIFVTTPSHSFTLELKGDTLYANKPYSAKYIKQ